MRYRKSCVTGAGLEALRVVGTGRATSWTQKSTTRHSSTILMELMALPASPGSRSDGFAIATCTGAGSVGGTSGELVEAVSTTGSGLFRAIDASATAPASDSLAIATSVGPRA